MARAGADILPDVVRPGLALLICGSAAGTVSAQRRAYYAHPQNRFWAVLADTGLTPRRLAPPDYPRLPEFGIGLTDITKTEFGADADLTTADPARLRATLARARPHALAFNGKRAARFFFARPTGTIAYGRQPDDAGATAVFVCPSTSPLAVRWWDPAPWHAVADHVRGRAAAADGRCP